MKKPQTGIVIAAPKAEAIMLEMNFDRSIGGIHTAVIGWIAGHEAEDENKKNTFFAQIRIAIKFRLITSKHET